MDSFSNASLNYFQPWPNITKFFKNPKNDTDKIILWKSEKKAFILEL